MRSSSCRHKIRNHIFLQIINFAIASMAPRSKWNIKCPLLEAKQTCLIRYSPESRHQLSALRCPFCAKSRLMHCKKLGSGNSFGTSAKRCELSWTGPIERNVLARMPRGDGANECAKHSHFMARSIHRRRSTHS